MMSDSKLALITGGASGIGFEVARQLTTAGVEVVIADLDSDAGRTAASDLGARFEVADLTRRDQVEAVVASLPRAPDIVVNSAGGGRRADVLDITEDDWLLAMQLNAGGLLRLAQTAAARAIAEGKPAAIVQISSALHKGPAPGLAHFSAAKAAGMALVRCLANELAPHRIRVNAVVPGPTETPMTQRAWALRDDDPKATYEARIPLARVGTPADIASAVSYLVSDAAEWVTGSVMTIDGGLAVSDHAVLG
jgi:NAD(P)-dependent dehydrogenase (short-subunit alcohol dehydrogenase family)